MNELFMGLGEQGSRILAAGDRSRQKRSGRACPRSGGQVPPRKRGGSSRQGATRKNILVANPKPKSTLQDDVKAALNKALSSKDRSLLVLLRYPFMQTTIMPGTIGGEAQADRSGGGCQAQEAGGCSRGGAHVRGQAPHRHSGQGSLLLSL